MGIDKFSKAGVTLTDQGVDLAELTDPAQQLAELAQDIEGE